jgi:myo-inositol-1(or 4)-monophosphatase
MMPLCARRRVACAVVTDETDLLGVAHACARAGAAALLARTVSGGAVAIRSKTSPTDLVSDADLAAEAAIREILAERRPHDAILAEEGGATGDGALRWVVDPLDGTINFLYGIPAFCVSIACEDGNGALVGVVLDPVREELFAATRSGPATLNGEPVQAPGRAQRLDVALIATGFGYDSKLRARQAEVVARVLPRARDVRRLGSAALDLCWTACGRFDGYYERGLNPWDLAAGALIAQRAGLELRRLEPTDADPGGILAGPAAWIDELYELVAAPS